VDTYEKKNQTVYSSSLDRGLYQFLMMLPEIRKSVPDFKVIVCYGLLNWEAAIKARNDVQSMELLNKIKALMEQPGVEYRGRVSKKVLSVLQKESKVFLFPSWFQETFCCTSVEAGLSKNPILSTDFAGLKTTVGSAGILLPHEGISRDLDYPESYKNRFIEESVRLLKDDDYRNEWAAKAYQKMQAYRWDKVAGGWIEQFKK
jgi:glycosyltransferase involved in cell wall biosynthesis